MEWLYHYTIHMAAKTTTTANQIAEFEHYGGLQVLHAFSEVTFHTADWFQLKKPKMSLL